MNKKRKYLICLVMILVICEITLFIFFRNPKYKMGETVTIDNFEITLTNYSYSKINKELILTFLIKNLNNYSITFNQDKYFKMYAISDFELYNTYESNTNVLKSNESTYYTLQYKVDEKKEYKIYFYPDNKKNQKIIFIIE
ncbi:MAG TPA: hypothetical protein PLT65_01600 [Bacilli bacterium]|nr:hypothetical protein [Bacilli bacterium]